MNFSVKIAVVFEAFAAVAAIAYTLLPTARMGEMPGVNMSTAATPDAAKGFQAALDDR